jgi:hypothetical protein
MTKTKDPFLAFYEGKDAIVGDENPYPPGTPCWHAWEHGYASENGPRTPMTPGEVKAAFARFRRDGS